MSKLTKTLKAAWYAPGYPARPLPFATTLVTGGIAIPAAVAFPPAGIALGVASAASFVYAATSDWRGNRKEIEAAEAKKQKQLTLF